MSFDRRRNELETILSTVLVEGYVLMSRAKMTRLLGRTEENQGQWQDILDIYQVIGGDPNELRGKRFEASLLLTRFDLSNPYTTTVFEYKPERKEKKDSKPSVKKDSKPSVTDEYLDGILKRIKE